MDAQEVKNEADLTAAYTAQHLQTQFVALAHKHATVSYGLIGVLVVVLALAGIGGYIAVRFADVQLARAEKAEQQYNADRKAWQDQLAADQAERVQDAQRQQVLGQQIAARDKGADKAITEALKPDASLPVIESGLRTAFKSVPGFDAPLPLNGVYIELGGLQAQQITAYKIDHDRLFGNLTDTKNDLKLEQDKTASLSKDLGGCEAENVEAKKVIDGYKNAAKVSRFRKFLGGAEKVAIFAAGAYLGHKF